MNQRDLLFKNSLDNMAKKIPEKDDLKALKTFCLEQIDEVSNKLENDLKLQIERIDELSDQVARTPAIATASMPPKLKIDIPKFKGHDGESPMKSAKNWWYLQNQNTTSIDEFIELLKEHYWNASVQRNIKRKVEFGKYNTNPDGAVSNLLRSYFCSVI